MFYVRKKNLFYKRRVSNEPVVKIYEIPLAFKSNNLPGVETIKSTVFSRSFLCLLNLPLPVINVDLNGTPAWARRFATSCIGDISKIRAGMIQPELVRTIPY